VVGGLLAFVLAAAAWAGDRSSLGASAEAQALEWKDIERAARDSRPETRAWAVRKAAAKGGKEGWQLVVEALRDPRSVVGDEALLSLAVGADEACLARLFPLLSEGDRVVRARLAELLGRASAAVRMEWLATLARDHDPEVARSGLSAVLRRLEAGRLSAEEGEAAAVVARLGCRARDPVLQCLAWRIGWRVAPALAEESVRAALGSPDEGVRAAAIASLQASPPSLALELAAQAVEDSAPRVRTASMMVLGPIERRAALRALAGRLPREGHPRLRHRLRLELANALGFDHGEDDQAWIDGAAAWNGGPSTGGGTQVRPTTKAHFSGLPLVSDRVAFLVDLSGSMWSAKVGDATRKEIVDRALARALESLPRGARVQLVPYTDRPIPWERAATSVDDARRRQALEWFAKRRDSGQGDFLEALESVLVDDHIDSVCVLTDGAPTGGERHELGLIFDRILDRNMPRQLAVDALLVDCAKSVATRWTSFCEATGGVARRIRIEDLLGEQEGRPTAGRSGDREARPEAPRRRSGGEVPTGGVVEER